MNRGYTREDYLEKIRFLREAMPESPEHGYHRRLSGRNRGRISKTPCGALEAVRFANIFSFRYSPRPRTAAARL